MTSVSRDRKAWTEAPLAKSLCVCIVGSGVAGVCTALGLALRGFRVTIFEAAKEIREVGAGINIGPNFSRVLEHLGVHQAVTAQAVQITSTSIRRFANDVELANADFSRMIPDYGHPPHVAHRADLMDSLFAACEATGRIDLHLGHCIDDIDLDAPAVKLPSGEWFHCDVLVAADGVKSAIRAKLLSRLGVESEAQDTGQAAYRIMLPYDKMASDSELKLLIEQPVVTRWIGPRRHIISYPISNHTVYNISTLQPDENFAEAPTSTWTTKGSKSEMMECFADFTPRVTRMLDMCPEGEVCEWKLRVHAPLPTWTEKSVVLVGDACHPTLPHLAQGAAQAAEDADVLAVVLSQITTRDDVGHALKIYQRIRKTRAERIVEGAAENGRGLHKADGSEQENRDQLFHRVKEGGSNPDKWADKQTQDMLFGVDCAEVAESRWAELLEAAKAGKLDDVQALP